MDQFAKITPTDRVVTAAAEPERLPTAPVESPRALEEETMPVILLWGIPTLFVVVGGGWWLMHH
jgi:hypothetical protein